MNRVAVIALLPLALATPVAAQTMDHSSMPGMAMPAQPAQPAKPKPKATAAPAAAHADHASAPTAPQPKAAPMDHSAMPGMSMPADAAAPDHGAMPGMTMPAGGAAQEQAAMPGMAMGTAAQAQIPKSPPPPPPTDHAADRFFAPAAMDAARALLMGEHGAMPASKVMANLAEYQARKSADGYRWDGQAWFGGDIHRFVVKSEGEGTSGEGVESAELQALYSRAVGVYTDVQAGVRQDFAPHGRTYATVGFETLLPYWFDVEGAAFLSTKGELLARVEGTYDLRLTQRWILQPRAELNFAAQDTPQTRTGSGLSTAELGLRLRYEVRREFAPYVGVSWERKAGRTADYARARGGDVEGTSLVVGVRAFF